MLKLLCAAAIAAYAYVPTLVAHVMFAADDPFGCRGCFHPCGTIMPIGADLANHVVFGAAILGMVSWGIYDLRKKNDKNGTVEEDNGSKQG